MGVYGRTRNKGKSPWRFPEGVVRRRAPWALAAPAPAVADAREIAVLCEKNSIEGHLLTHAVMGVPGILQVSLDFPFPGWEIIVYCDTITARA